MKLSPTNTSTSSFPFQKKNQNNFKGFPIQIPNEFAEDKEFKKDKWKGSTSFLSPIQSEHNLERFLPSDLVKKLNESSPAKSEPKIEKESYEGTSNISLIKEDKKANDNEDDFVLYLTGYLPTYVRNYKKEYKYNNWKCKICQYVNCRNRNRCFKCGLNKSIALSHEINGDN
ncbi:MAG: zinc finger Ran-binding domain-containing protein [archaeon]|nr:zinc finger Ran-binding domain-containing protein [archaeon]